MKFHENDKCFWHNQLCLYLQCDSILLSWIPFKSESIFSLNNKEKKKPGIFWGAGLLSKLQWFEGRVSVTVRVKRFIYPWHRWCCAGPHSQPDWYLVYAVKYTKVGSCGLVLSHAQSRFSEPAGTRPKIKYNIALKCINGQRDENHVFACLALRNNKK